MPSSDSVAEADLPAASTWLYSSNQRHARAWGMGEERRSILDREAGMLTLVFRDGKRARLPVRIIGTFVPRERQVTWLWEDDTSALSPAVIAKSLAAIPPERTFNRFVQLGALTAMRADCVGLYRCVGEDHCTTLVGFDAPSFEAKDGRPLQSGALWSKGQPELAFEGAAGALIAAWDAEMLPIDRDYYRQGTDPQNFAALEAAIDAKDEVCARYWRAKNQLWRPNDVGWPSEHDPDGFLPTMTLPRRSGGCFVVRMLSPYRIRAYVVELFDGKPWITDIEMKWGDGLVWIDGA